MNNHVEKVYKKFARKYYFSIFWFITLNIISISVASLLIFLNIYAIKKNSDEYLKIIFVIITILGSLGAFINSLISFFTIKKHAKASKNNIELIKHEEKLFKNRHGKYELNENPEKLYIHTIMELSEK